MMLGKPSRVHGPPPTKGPPKPTALSVPASNQGGKNDKKTQAQNSKSSPAELAPYRVKVWMGRCMFVYVCVWFYTVLYIQI